MGCFGSGEVPSDWLRALFWGEEKGAVELVVPEPQKLGDGQQKSSPQGTASIDKSTTYQNHWFLELRG